MQRLGFLILLSAALSACSEESAQGVYDDAIELVETVGEGVSTDGLAGELPETYPGDVIHQETTDTCDICSDEGGEIPCAGDDCLDVQEDEAGAAFCGDGDCGEDETCDTCPEDCDPCCGNGDCDFDETCDTCPDDCDPCCGNGECDFDETCETCEEDCDPCCGNGECDFEETCDSCPDDCDVCCGNGECDFEETCDDCPEDCDVCCGNGECDFEETCETCLEDCGECPVCGDGLCEEEKGETCEECQTDCGYCPELCGNGVCDVWEGCLTCPEDCFGDDCCGDFICDDELGEDCETCADDCGDCMPYCGDGILQEYIGEQCEDGNTENGDGCDEDCQIEPVPAEPGSIIITEIMKNPAKTSDALGEWFELYNTTNGDIDINGWTVEDLGADGGVLFNPEGIVIPAESYFVLVANLDQDENGGVEGDELYINVLMSNTGDEVILRVGEVIIDQVIYESTTFPNTSGKALSLDPGSLTGELNDLGENWCDAVDVYGAGDFGSPGLENPLCSADPECGDDDCNGDESCLTCPTDCGECCGNGQCDEPFGENCLTCVEDCGDCCGDDFCDEANGEDCITCAEDCGGCCGNGDCQEAHGEDCVTCVADCGECCGNGACDHQIDETCSTCPLDCGQCCGDGDCDWTIDETCQTCVLDCGLCPAVCGNGAIEPGEACDDGNEEDGDGCSALCLLEFPTDLEPGMLVITEIMKNPKLVPDLEGEWIEITNVSTAAIDIDGWTLKDADSDAHIIDSGGALVVEPGAIVVLGNNADAESNGGVQVFYEYSAFTLANGTDEVMLVAPNEGPDGVLIDSVFFTDAEYPDSTGKALSLDPESYNQAANDLGSNWCDAAFVMSGGDFGSPGSPNPGCTSVAVCGNGLVESGEDCDDGNAEDCDGCNEECKFEMPSVCGNGVLEPCEECDDGNLIPGDGCTDECLIFVPSICGNGDLEPGEECDDGNNESLDGCSEDCILEGICGNGIIEPGEGCDDGNNEDGDGCGAMCDVEFIDALCGNGVVEGPGATWPEGDPPPPEQGTEWCDDGNQENGDGCSSDCLLEDIVTWVCGNGVIEPYVDENCDDGNTENGDGCNEWCKNECTGLCEPCGTCCGDGFTTPGEDCDDGNLINGDGCSDLCTYELSTSSIAGTITYDGEPDQFDTIWIMAYDAPEDDPVNPVGEPDHVDIVPAVFPLEYNLPVSPGTLYLGIVMDLGGDGEEGFGEEDFGVFYEVDGEAAGIVVGDNQNVTGIDVALTAPEGPELGSIAGVVSYTGNVTENDALVIYLSSTPLPDLDIVKEIKYKPAEFPVSYHMLNVTPGAYYVIAAFDENDDLQEGGQGDNDILINYIDEENPTQVTVGPGEDVVDIDVNLSP